MTKRVGYAKLGRTIDLDPDEWGTNGGDNEPPCLLNKLAIEHPDVEWVLVGRNSGENPQELGFPDNVTNPWTEWKPAIAEHNKGGKAADRQRAQDVLDEYTRDTFLGLDGMVIWAGQHGTSNSRIPTVEDPSVLTEPQISFIHYASYLVRGINAWRDLDPLKNEEVWLCPDPRNYLKARDLKWPLRNPVLSQYNWVRPDKHERYGDMRSPDDLGFSATGAFVHNNNVWQSPYRYTYSRLETVGIPSNTVAVLDNWEERQHFGILINEARNYVKNDRLTAMLDYVKPIDPAWVYGKWTPNSLEKLGMGAIEGLHYSKVFDQVRTVKATFTTPSSGSGWATTKPWEAFAVGTACLFHPEYDTQGHIIPTLAQVESGKVDDQPELKALAQWLRVKEPDDLQKRVKALDTSRETWEWLVAAQRRHFDRQLAEKKTIKMIEGRLGLNKEGTSSV